MDSAVFVQHLTATTIYEKIANFMENPALSAALMAWEDMDVFHHLDTLSQQRVADIVNGRITFETGTSVQNPGKRARAGSRFGKRVSKRAVRRF